MARTNLTRNESYNPLKVQAKLTEHDTALDALDTTGTLPANSVSNTELADMAALTVKVRASNSSGDPSDVAAVAASGSVLRESGSALSFGTLTNAALAAGILSADATGRALMATDLFDAATVLLKIADGAFANDAATRALFADNIWTNAKLAAGILSADATGRALVASDFFDATTALAKFATDSVSNAVLLKAVADGAFVADAATRALFAAGFINGSKIAAGSLDQFMVTAGNGAGARTMTGASVGDKVVAVMNITDGTDNSADFETTVTIADQIQQTATNIDNDKVIVTVIKV